MPVWERVICIWLFCASTLGLRSRSTHFPIHAPTRPRAGGGRLGVMNTTSAYIVNAILVLLVVRQIREHRMDLRGLAGPVLAVATAAVFLPPLGACRG